MRTLGDLTQQREAMIQATAYVDYCRMLARGGRLDDLPDREPYRRLKAAVSITDDAALKNLAAEFIRLVEQGTVIGQMAGAWLPAPPYVPIVAGDDAPAGTFIPSGAPIPVAKLTLTAITTEISKLAEIIAFDRRTLESQDPRARTLFERRFVNRLRTLEDREFLSTTAAIAGVRPAGILAGLTPVGGGASLAEDLAALVAAVSGGMPIAPYFICSPSTAQYLAALQPPVIRSAAGSTAIGVVPVVTSPAAANRIILIDASRLVVVDELLDVASSSVAAIQMDDAPTNNAATGAGAQLVSGFQTNSAFVRAVRYIWWALLADNAVAFTEIAALASGS